MSQDETSRRSGRRSVTEDLTDRADAALFDRLQLPERVASIEQRLTQMEASSDARLKKVELALFEELVSRLKKVERVLSELDDSNPIDALSAQVEALSDELKTDGERTAALAGQVEQLAGPLDELLRLGADSSSESGE